jgi:probable addiction module antidote protein
MKKPKIELTDFFEDLAKRLNSPKKIQEFIDGANKAYDETGDEGIILTAIRILAMAKGNQSKLARTAKIDRKSLYNLSAKKSNPTFKTISSISKNLGLRLHLTYML